MKKRHFRKSIRIALDTFLISLTFISFLYILFNAVMQKSYSMNPPSQQEIVEDPGLIRYVYEWSM